MTGAAADTGQTALAARKATGTPELSAVATADTGDAALATGTAARAAVEAARPAVTVGVAAAAARVLRNEMSYAGTGSARARRDYVS